jgi:hypothetical protein
LRPGRRDREALNRELSSAFGIVGWHKLHFDALFVEVAVHPPGGPPSRPEGSPEGKWVEQRIHGLRGIAQRLPDVFSGSPPGSWAVPAHKVDVEGLGPLSLVIRATAESAPGPIREAIEVLAPAPAEQSTEELPGTGQLSQVLVDILKTRRSERGLLRHHLEHQIGETRWHRRISVDEPRCLFADVLLEHPTGGVGIERRAPHEYLPEGDPEGVNIREVVALRSADDLRS